MTLTLTPSDLDAPSPEILGDATAVPVRRRWLRLWRPALGIALALALGNLFILAASALAKEMSGSPVIEVPEAVASIRNFKAIDANLWRGGAPGAADYRALAAAGVTTVIDLRAEENLTIPNGLIAELALTRVTIPIRDGQAPTPAQVQRFAEAVETSDGTVFVHCGAGVGRTGTMVAAYTVARGGGGWDAMRANLAVGPPSLEQLAFAASLDADEPTEGSNAALVALSRTLDAPRRIWKVLEGR